MGKELRKILQWNSVQWFDNILIKRGKLFLNTTKHSKGQTDFLKRILTGKKTYWKTTIDGKSITTLGEKGTVYLLNGNQLFLPSLFIHSITKYILPKNFNDSNYQYPFKLLAHLSFAFPFDEHEKWIPLEKCVAGMIATRMNFLWMTGEKYCGLHKLIPTLPDNLLEREYNYLKVSHMEVNVERKKWIWTPPSGEEKIDTGFKWEVKRFPDELEKKINLKEGCHALLCANGTTGVDARIIFPLVETKKWKRLILIIQTKVSNRNNYLQVKEISIVEKVEKLKKKYPQDKVRIHILTDVRLFLLL